MLKRATGILVVLAAVGMLTGPVQSQPLYRPDIVVIKLKDAAARQVGFPKRSGIQGVAPTGVASLDSRHAQLGAVNFERTVPTARPASQGGHDRFGLSRYYTVELPPGSDVEAAIETYMGDPNVEYAEPDYIMPIYGVPTDPSYGQQWTHAFLNDQDIDTQEAWDLEVGDSTVIVAIIDSGVQYDHEDLAANIWVNPGEDLDGDGVPWDPDDMNGLDDDHDTLFLTSGGSLVLADDLVGWDFMPVQTGCWAGEDCNGPDNDPMDFAGHGTHVGGIVGAVTSNSKGVAGVAGGWRSDHRPGVKLMCLRAGYLRNDGNGFVIMTACAQAFDYAVAHGASVANCSWGTSGTLIQSAALNALAAGMTITKAAGNDNDEVSDVLNDLAGVLSVASVDKLGGKSSFSSYGTWVEISAPGSEILNTYSNLGSPTYATLQGTSMAAPTVAGVAALVKSHHPWMTRVEVDSILLATAENIDAKIPGFLGKMGAGRVNALNALAGLTTAAFNVDVLYGDAPLTVNFTDVSPNAPSGPYLYTFGDGDSATTADASHTYTAPGLYDVTFTASGPTGPHTVVRPQMLLALQDTIAFGSATIEEGQIDSVTVRINNSHPVREIVLPFNLVGPANVRIQDFKATGLLANWAVQKTLDNTFFGQGAWLLRAAPLGAPLPAGGGIIGYLKVHVVDGAGGAIETVDTANFGTGKHLEVESAWARYKPKFAMGEITIPAPPCQCDCFGDPQCDGFVNVLDVVQAVNIAFKGSAPLPDPSASCPFNTTDVDCSGATNVLDVVRFVNVAFKGGTAATQFCDPCAP